MTTTTFDVDIDCSYCFDEVLHALRSYSSVTEIQGSIAEGCLSVTHDTDVDRIADLIARVGHRLIVADNAEVVLGGVHVTPGRACGRHP